jgi:uncharacterized protein YjdB
MQKLTVRAFDAIGAEVLDGVVVWTSANPGVAEVQDGLVIAVAKGTTTLTATVEQGVTTVEVTVIDPVTAIAIVPAEATIAVGQQSSLRAELVNRDGDPVSGVSVTWAIDGDSTVASVDGEGVVTGLAPGTVQVLASAEGQRASAAVTVVSGALSISGHALLTKRSHHTATRVSVEGTGLFADTDATGFYRIDGLVPGDYTVSFTHEGFQSQRVPVHLEDDLVLDVTLEFAASDEGGCACRTSGRGRIDGGALLLVVVLWRMRRKKSTTGPLPTRGRGAY